MTICGPRAFTFHPVSRFPTTRSGRPAWLLSLPLALLLIVSAHAQGPSPLPNAPLPQDEDKTPRSGGNGGPEFSNATPQVKQSIQDQSDDQASPAFFNDHLIRDRFWVSGQSNFISRPIHRFTRRIPGPTAFTATERTPPRARSRSTPVCSYNALRK